MDVLSEVLKVVKLDGAFFYNAEFSSPWSFRSPPSRTLARYVAPSAGHVIIYHLLIEGRGFARLEDGERIPLEAGDIVIFPHGDAHVMDNGSRITAVDDDQKLARIFSQGLKISRMGGGGEVTRFVCGYMACDPRLAQAVLSGLPPVFKVNIRNDDAGRWLENSIRFSVGEAGASRPGGEAVLAKLSEALFVETLRRYIGLLPVQQTGWLAGARDPQVGNALALMHRSPARPWTIADLARETGISRSVLAERFRHYLGEPPMSYLTRWRLQLGAHLLKSSSSSVLEIAAEVGYESEAAFNRAFKREFGLPPARFRNQAKSARAAAAHHQSASPPRAVSR
ncbi:MAG TPA: AraC family transcriptional regulator [Candidatus Bathyarchaeia archaeon]|nr:AraC family transcriptional regulator [Candidatus Bathyarchaeia archaeon]